MSSTLVVGIFLLYILGAITTFFLKSKILGNSVLIMLYQACISCAYMAIGNKNWK